MATTRIKIKESLKQWAFETTDLGEDTLVEITQRNKWLQQSSKLYLQPTVKQLGAFATRLHIPFGSLLLDKPPKTEDIRLAFRTQQNVPAEVSLNVRDIIYEMRRKQSWFKEESGLANQKLSIVGSASKLNNAETLNAVLNLLTLNHFNSPRDLFNDLRDQLAHLGILNMQKGNAGLGTTRPLDVSELRAFVLLDDYAPLIFINQKDSYTARIFSLIHEFIHILHGSDELLSDKDTDVTEERNINKIVSAFLMPEGKFKNIFKNHDINKTARYFNTSPEAAAIRAQEIGLINNINEVAILSNSGSLKKSSGGNPYNNALTLNDKRYMNALVSAQETGTIQPTQAATLIGISYKMLDKTIETFNEREALV
ncbi:hypothetical protein LOOC260_102630 [Paucilactobacillus hokkaidonensis JCM 18461]|uniref:IrrE N-terminal-like domain-containing protein n=2 Tax=Paucilactobacillus hokkaidonensis TaxID=1193095 RepID=A0A0A1GWQ6_9LACO|nr:ImmA/IrrE family metallo-endopeptidase [Paucilactobacillus hokkaidonensis]KRO09335.1 hypothetical protein IV59_GL000673 [Paucilactobacillus hokkaidonensis]BAP84841.1 hypothetical protein LOOC260_102630 [Paucilactobacillus hokkaidonensis JCM 18461]